jgi:hypothetical protein
MVKYARVLFVLGILILVGGAAEGETIWTGPTMTFTKANHADWTLPQNQDRLSADVWITRANTNGIFNIKQEPAYNNIADPPVSPLGTEWAYGSAANWQTLTFQDWEDWTKIISTAAHGDPPSTLGKPAVLHLISENIYLDIKFTSWAVGGAAGGGFSYQRSTSVPEPSTLIMLGTLAITIGWWRRRKSV